MEDFNKMLAYCANKISITNPNNSWLHCIFLFYYLLIYFQLFLY